MSHPNVLNSTDAILVVIDVQDTLLKAIHQADRVVRNTVKLIEAAKVFDIPVLVTVQYPEKLGGCNELVTAALPEVGVFPKTAFSCLGCKEFAKTIETTGRHQVILCGVETHVCVNQTAHDLLAIGLQVHVVRDAVSSRTVENYEVGIGKMRDSGCIITSTETAIFEMTRDASRAEFKQILPIVK